MSGVRLNHIGIAVQNRPEMERLFRLLGLVKTHEESVPSQGVNTHFYPLPVDGLAFELLEPVDPAGVIAKFMEKKGPGIHHLSLTVEKGGLDSLLSDLKQNGFTPLYPEPRPGAHQMRINFLHPKTTGGVLIELMEPADAH
ncbi:MAG: methylmalonyl-CoA epimerase [Proteobacteria bacterium]|nr:MAG: methylmalonyl-CoA epimerase [Pseudomonadota bacterium]